MDSMQTRCDEVTEALVAQGLHAVALHGGRTQSEREAALRDFRSGSTNILVYIHLSQERIDAASVMSFLHSCMLLFPFLSV